MCTLAANTFHSWRSEESLATPDYKHATTPWLGKSHQLRWRDFPAVSNLVLKLKLSDT